MKYNCPFISNLKTTTTMDTIFIIHSLTHSHSGHLEGIGVVYTPDGGMTAKHTGCVEGFAKAFYLNGVAGAEAQRVYRDTIGSTNDKAVALLRLGLEQIKY